jgi:hypothetical protein
MSSFDQQSLNGAARPKSAAESGRLASQSLGRYTTIDSKIFVDFSNSKVQCLMKRQSVLSGKGLVPTLLNN